MNPNIIASYALISSLKDSGVTHCVISPGSRSTPLAFVANELLDCVVVIDEREAGFVALGIAESTGIAPVVITTSGSAPTHLFPSVVEAFHSKIPLIILSADRPHEVRGRGAPQTIDQVNLFGLATRYFSDAICPHDETDLYYWHEYGRIISEAAQGFGSVSGPVHLNMGMREPLTPDGDEKKFFEDFYENEISGKQEVVTKNAAWKNVSNKSKEKRSFGFGGINEKNVFSHEIRNKIRESKNGVVTVGRGSALTKSELELLVLNTRWPVLCDVIGNFRNIDGVITTYDFVLRNTDAKSLIPDVVIQFGEPLTSKLFNETISDSFVVAIKNSEDGRDPYGNYKSEVVLEALDSECMAEFVKIETLQPEELNEKWSKIQSELLGCIDEVKSEQSNSEPALFIDLGEQLSKLEGAVNVLLASSMPVRYAEWFWPSIGDLTTVFSHRGTNGIDGMLSSAYGIAHGSKRETLCVLGDVAFRHDIGFLSSCAAYSAANSECIVIALIDNGGGAIFRHLDQAKSETLKGVYEQLLQTPTGLDFESMVLASKANYYSGNNEECISKISSLLQEKAIGTHVVHFVVEHESGPKFMTELKETISKIG